MVFVAKTKNILHLVGVGPRARSLGLQSGMTLADARARIPGLRAVTADPSADAVFIEHLADLALAVTPSVALDPPDGLALDITGCSHLFGGETALAARLRDVLRTAGVSVAKLAVASTPDMARALARFSRTTPCFADDNSLVRELPVAALESTQEDTTALKRAGLKTIADVANRPSLLFTARFTPAFTTKLARVLGEEDRRISPLRKPAPYRAEQRIPEPVTSHDAISGILAELSATVSDRLTTHGLGGRLFEGTFLRADGAVRRIRIETSRPTRNPDVIMRLYRDRLDGLSDPLDPGFGFDMICFEAVQVEPYTESQATLDAHHDRKEKIAQLVDRLTVMLGRERVMRLRPVNSHIPERAQSVAPAALVATSREWANLPPSSDSRLRPALIYARPHPIEVEARSDDALTGFRWRRVTHRVAQVTGPERIAEEWWRTPLGYGTRDYYRVENSDGRRFWIFRAEAPADGERDRWFLHGLFL